MDSEVKRRESYFSGSGREALRLGGAAVVAWIFFLGATYLTGVRPGSSLKTVEELVPRYETGEQMSCGWRYLKAGKADRASKLFFETPGGMVEVHFELIDPSKPCYARTRFLNVAYKAGRDINICEEKQLNTLIRNVREKEPPIALKKKSDLSMLLFGRYNNYWNTIVLLTAALIVMLFLFDVSSTSSLLWKGLSEGKRTGPTNPGMAWTAAFFSVVILCGKIRTIYWNYFSLDDFSFYPPRIVNVQKYLDYVTGDTGYPALVIRTLFPLLVQTESLVFMRLFSIVIVLVSVALLYMTAGRHMRSSLAVMTCLWLLASRTLDYGIQDMRGHVVYVFFIILCMLMYQNAIETPKPMRMFGWAASAVFAAASNPLAMTLAVGPVYFYLFAYRKTAPMPVRRSFDLHFVFLAAAFLLISPFAFRSAVTHSADATGWGSARMLSGETGLLLFSAIILLAAAIHWRREYAATLMIASFSGIAFTAILFAARGLSPDTRYYVFVIPILSVCSGIIVERLIRFLEKRLLPANKIAVVALVLFLTSVTMKSASDFVDRKGASEEAFNKKATMIEQYLQSVNHEEYPVVMYSIKHYYYFLIHKYKVDYFDRSTGNEFYGIREVLLPSGHRVVKLGNQYAASCCFEKPAKVFGEPVYIVALDVFNGERGMYFESSLKKRYRLAAGCIAAAAAGNATVLYCDGK